MTAKSFYRIFLLLLCFSFFYSCKNDKQKYENLPEELAALNRKIDKSPKDDKLYYQRANYYYFNRMIEDAQEDALQTIKLKPEKVEYYILLSDIYFAKRETDLTEETLEKAIAVDPANNEARLKLAELYLHTRMLEECERVIDEAVTLQPHNPKAHIIKAFSLKSRGDTLGYLRMLLLTVDQDPTEVKAFLELGYYYQQKLDPIAISYYQNALLVDPDNVQINYNLALLYQDLEEIEKAEEYYHIILQIDPNHKSALNNLGYIRLVFEDKYQDAVNYFSKAIEKDPQFINAIANRGIAYEYLEEYELARQDFKHCLELYPLHEPAINGLNRLDKIQ